MASKVSRYTVGGWIEVSDWDGLDARLDVIEAGITAQPPAFIGKRPGTATDAWHSRIDGTTVNPTGLAFRSGLAFMQLDKPATFGIYQSTVAGGPTSNRIANFNWDISEVNGWNFGSHPAYGPGYRSLWRTGADASRRLHRACQRHRHLPQLPNTTMHLRRGNTDILSIGTDNKVLCPGVVSGTNNTDIGNNSIYFAGYGGGWYMNDSTWIRSTNQKNVWLAGGWYGTDGGISIGRGGATDGSYKCDVAGNIRCDGTLYGGDNVFATRQVKSSWNDYGSDALELRPPLVVPLCQQRPAVAHRSPLARCRSADAGDGHPG